MLAPARNMADVLVPHAARKMSAIPPVVGGLEDYENQAVEPSKKRAVYRYSLADSCCRLRIP